MFGSQVPIHIVLVLVIVVHQSHTCYMVLEILASHIVTIYTLFLAHCSSKD